jgi:beta-N-acetylhexosaminidase
MERLQRKRSFSPWQSFILIILFGGACLSLIFLAASIIYLRPANPEQYVGESIERETSTGTPRPTPNPEQTITSGRSEPSTQSKTPGPTATVTPTPITLSDIWIDKVIEKMSPSQKIGQMILAGVDGKTINSSTCIYLGDITPGGIIYRKGNVDTPDQLRQLSEGLQGCSKKAGNIPLLIAIDHEGQYVNRFDSGVTVFPAALAQGATGSPIYAKQVAYHQGQELGYAGINMVLGPVADLLTDYDNIVISQRSFGGDPQRVSQDVANAVLGYGQSGIVAVLKHFPGHGGVATDSHTALPYDKVGEQTLMSDYIPPFQSGIDAGAGVVMFGHLAYPSIDPANLPASMSEVILNILRQQMHFPGVILTDSMGMGAIKNNGWTVPGASLQAVNAGVDMLLVTSTGNVRQTHAHLLNALKNGQLSQDRVDQAVRRILKLKAEAGIKSYPLASFSVPKRDASRSIAYDTGYNAVALHRDNIALVPIPENVKNVLIIAPPDAWGFDHALNSTFQDRGIRTQFVHYSPPWQGPITDRNLLSSTVAKASGYDLALVLTWEAHLNHLKYGDTWQVDLVNQLLSKDIPTIVVALKSPTDILEFPQVDTYLATYGTTPGQVQALADILVGHTQPQGLNPLPGLP